MALVIERPGRVLGAAALIGAALLAVGGWLIYPYAKWFYRNVPSMEFEPACRTYAEPAHNSLRFVQGPPTNEFWHVMMKNYRGLETPPPHTTVIDGKVYKPMGFFGSLPEKESRFLSQKEESSYFATRRVAYHIFKKREAEGRFEGEDMTPFMVKRWSEAEQAEVWGLMRPDECGFLEELILEGGRFAGPAPD